MAKKLLILLLAAGVMFLQACSCSTWVELWGGDPGQECLTHWDWKPKEEPVVVKEEPIEVEVMVPCAAPRLVQASRREGGRTGMEIDLMKMAPREIAINEPFEYRLKITNTTNQELLNVVVTDVMPEHMKVLSSDPEMEVVAGQVSWTLGALAPNASKTISVNAMALKTGTITTCAEVTYDTPTCAKVEVVEPILRLAKQAPAESLRCERIPIRYIITNTGTGHACSITISDKFSEGMVTSEGRGAVSFEIDILGPGETKEFDVMVDAIKSGRFASIATASAEVGGKASSEMVETIATEPSLRIEHSGPQRQYIGRSVTYDVTITNEGDAVAKATILEVMIPEEAKFKGATAGGVFTRSSPGKVTWNIGSLNPNESRKVSVTVTGESPGKLMMQATAKAFCAEAVTDSAQTDFSGIGAVLLEVVDISDPVEIGQTTTYVVTVTNQGSASETNVQIKCMLEAGMEYVSSSGPSKASVVGNTITFAPFASLAPKAQAKWLVNVKAVGTGDKRFKTTMITERLDRPVEETEATKFYE